MADRPPPEREKLVLLVHGIRTAARWQSRIAPQLTDEHTKVEPIGYGYFNVFEFLSPWLTRKRAISQIEWRIRCAIKDNPGRELSIIAHSFGTYCVSRILIANPGMEPVRVIFCGSVVDANFRWDQLRQQFDFINDCGTKDIWPCFARSTTWGYGASGTFGFKTPGRKDRFHRMGHGGYFVGDFAVKYWAPFIRDGTVRPSEDPVAMEEPTWYTSLLAMRPFWWPWLGWIVVLLGLLMFNMIQPPLKQPAIVTILPSDSFGPNCRVGFDSAMALRPDITPIVLDGATIAQLKASRTDAIEAGLKEAFSNYRVIGVVGPPISECAYSMANKISELDPKVPVMLTSAVSGNDPMWGVLRRKIPLYRVGSDISQRAKEVQELLKALLANKKKVVFLIEGQGDNGPRSFGLRFFDELETEMDYFSHISKKDYVRIVFPWHQEESVFEELKPHLTDPETVVFLLGVDFELKSLIEQFYKDSSDFVPKARVVGWMCAHMLDTVYHSGTFHSELVIDISDYSRSNARYIQNVDWQEDVTKRDAMNYFDSTLVLLDAWKKMKGRTGKHGFGPGKHDMDRFAAAIAGLNTKGIGGEIRFDSTGQNTRPLIFLRYSYETKSWVEIHDVNKIVYEK